MNHYIKGNDQRGKEVIHLLEKEGGINNAEYNGRNTHGYYYIDPATGCITCAILESIKCNIEKFYEELTLPKKIFKFKEGEKALYNKTSEVVTILKVDGDIDDYIIKQSDGHYTSVPESSLTSIEDWSPKRGDPVLVKFGPRGAWREATLSFKLDNKYFVYGGGVFPLCIPFDESKLGKITD